VPAGYRSNPSEIAEPLAGNHGESVRTGPIFIKTAAATQTIENFPT
jgi:hypothetical protein